MRARKLKMELWRVCSPVVTDLRHFGEEQERLKMELCRAVDTHNKGVEAQNDAVESLYTVKKRLAIFPSPAGISLTKLSLAGIN